MYRASSVAPEYKYETAYENWEDLGCPFAGLDEEYDFDPFDGVISMVAYGDYLYCFGGNESSIIKYHTVTKKWSYGDSLPVESDGEAIGPDARTRNNTCVVGNSIICASASQGGGGIYSSSLLKYYLLENDYGYSGWETFPYQRQPEAVYASAVTDYVNRVFFLSINGTITVFYLDTGSLDTEGRVTMPLHGETSRDYMIPAFYNGKIYVAGGSGNSGYYLDIYGIDEDSWSSGAVLPYPVDRAHSLYYDGFIYVLPYGSVSSFEAVLKYNILDNCWSIVKSLGYNYKTSYLDVAARFPGNHPVPDVYCLCGEFVYAYNDTRRDFRRFKVKRESWESGCLPSVEDSGWYGDSCVPWYEATVSGELMPQDRYIQYKVVLEAASSGLNPILSNSCIAKPLVLEDVPASGTSSLFVKTGISMEREYEAWYIGYDSNSEPSIIYAVSNDGTSFYNTTFAFGGLTSSGITYDFGYVDSYVLKSSVVYEMWTTYAEVSTNIDRWGSLYYTTSLNGYSWEAPVFSVGTSVEGTYDTYHVYSPSVLNESGIYNMWYTAVDSELVSRILTATSLNGVVWSNVELSHNVDTALLEYSADSDGVCNPSVIKVENLYYMWYEGIDSGGVSRIIHCKSYDGRSWFGHSVVLDKNSVGNDEIAGCGKPCVKLEFDTYHIWFSGYISLGEIVYHSISVDGITWVDISGVLSKNLNGEKDTSYATYFCALASTPVVEPSVLHNVRLKVHNGNIS